MYSSTRPFRVMYDKTACLRGEVKKVMDINTEKRLLFLLAQDILPVQIDLRIVSIPCFVHVL
jgi:hypothetical protein